MAAAAWRMAEAREEEHHLRPNMPSSIPSTGECNVKCRSVCVSVRVCVCVCVWWFRSERMKGWRAPSSPRLCRRRRLWAAGERSPRTRSRRPGRCCCETERRLVSTKKSQLPVSDPPEFRLLQRSASCVVYSSPSPNTLQKTWYSLCVELYQIGVDGGVQLRHSCNTRTRISMSHRCYHGNCFASPWKFRAW